MDTVQYDKNTSILFVLIPSWSIRGPPYNLARLSALAESKGYKSTSIDLNIIAYNDSKNWGLNYDPWHTNRDWKWLTTQYFTDIHPHLEKHLLNCLAQIKKLQPTVIGFTQYYCNEVPMDWLIKKIKEECPDIAIVVGGVNIFANMRDESHLLAKPYDYIVAGEGERPFLQILEEIESGAPRTIPKLTVEQGDVRTNLETMPISNYRDYDFNNYQDRSIDIEISKGCIAKCVFCNETHYWKFRERSGENLLAEVKFLYEKYKITNIYFVDSLVNGDLRQLAIFAQGLIDNKIKVIWHGQARCDKRMDIEYLQRLRDSGCFGFGIGCEAGSDKVLKHINKKITRADIEQNIADSGTVGLRHTSLWFVGFPTEFPQDYYETIVLNWNLLPSGAIACASINMFYFEMNSIISQDAESYDLIDICYLKNCIGTNFNNTKVHSLVKRKGVDIFLNFCSKIQNRNHNFLNFNLGGLRPTISNFYKINFSTIRAEKLEFDQVDFNIITTGLGPFADSLINDIWPIFRVFWRILGRYDIEIHFNPIDDFNEYGDSIDFAFTATYRFSIDENDKWAAEFDLSYEQPKHAWQSSRWRNPEVNTSNTFMSDRIQRFIKKLAVPSEKQLKIENTFNQYKDLDLSFRYKYKGVGQW